MKVVKFMATLYLALSTHTLFSQIIQSDCNLHTMSDNDTKIQFMKIYVNSIKTLNIMLMQTPKYILLVKIINKMCSNMTSNMSVNAPP